MSTAVCPLQTVAELTVALIVWPPPDVTVTEAVLTQPFTASVAVTVYVPAAFTIAGFDALESEPPFQTIAFPALVPE